VESRAKGSSGTSRSLLASRLGNLDHRRLLYLSEAADAGSIRNAAERLNTTASVISRQIVKMEEFLQIPLIERHGRGITLTEAGELLVAHYKEQQDRASEVVAQIQDLSELRRGHVSLAVGEGFLRELMGNSLRSFSVKHPHLRVEIHVGGTDDLVRRVADDEAHLGLLYNLPPEPRVIAQASARHPLRVATAPNHPLVKLGRKIILDDLKPFELGLLPGAFGVRQALLSLENRRKVTLSSRLIANSSRVLIQYAEEWNGIILTPAFAISREIEDGRLVALETDESFLENVEAQLVTRRGRRLPVAASQLLRHLQATLPLLQKQRQK
jgi:DNA-binding transcriptional LysR family regulator